MSRTIFREYVRLEERRVEARREHLPEEGDRLLAEGLRVANVAEVELVERDALLLLGILE